MNHATQGADLPGLRGFGKSGRQVSAIMTQQKQEKLQKMKTNFMSKMHLNETEGEEGFF